MRKLTTGEITNLKITTAESFNNLCDVVVISGYQDSYGQEIDTVTYTYSGVPCGFQATNSITYYKGQVVVADFEAKVRLPLTQPISTKDKVKVGDSTFKVDGINQGLTCITVVLEGVGRAMTDIKGLKELNEQLTKLEKLVEHKNAILAGAYTLQRFSMQNAPVKTGFLRQSMTSRETEEGAEMEVQAEYAFYVEFGNSHWEGKPYVRPAIDEHRDDIVNAVSKVLQQEVKDNI